MSLLAEQLRLCRSLKRIRISKEQIFLKKCFEITDGVTHHRNSFYIADLLLYVLTVMKSFLKCDVLLCRKTIFTRNKYFIFKECNICIFPLSL